jgi:hypothetical protein
MAAAPAAAPQSAWLTPEIRSPDPSSEPRAEGGGLAGRGLGRGRGLAGYRGPGLAANLVTGLDYMAVPILGYDLAGAGVAA